MELDLSLISQDPVVPFRIYDENIYSIYELFQNDQALINPWATQVSNIESSIENLISAIDVAILNVLWEDEVLALEASKEVLEDALEVFVNYKNHLNLMSSTKILELTGICISYIITKIHVTENIENPFEYVIPLIGSVLKSEYGGVTESVLTSLSSYVASYSAFFPSNVEDYSDEHASLETSIVNSVNSLNTQYQTEFNNLGSIISQESAALGTAIEETVHFSYAQTLWFWKINAESYALDEDNRHMITSSVYPLMLIESCCSSQLLTILEIV